jgi:transcriptional regulator with XRE-family HTH domain
MTQKKSVKTRTSTFLRKLFTAPDLEKFIENNSHEMEIPSFDAYITELCRSNGLVPEQVIKQSDIERTYGHQLFNGTRKPSREKVLQLAFGLGLSVDETQKLLKIARKNALYPKYERDAVILFCLEKKKSIFETQSLLQELKLTLLSGNNKYG